MTFVLSPSRLTVLSKHTVYKQGSELKAPFLGKI